MRERVTIQDHQSSRFICEPLHLLDYCLINDGGVALILTTPERAKDLAKPPVYIRGFSQASALSGSAMPSADFWFAPMQAAANAVYALAGVRPGELSALMVYDNFSQIGNAACWERVCDNW